MKVSFAALFNSDKRVAKHLATRAKEAKKALRASVRKVCAGVAKAEKVNLTRERTGALKQSLGPVVKQVNEELIVGKAGALKGFRITLDGFRDVVQGRGKNKETVTKLIAKKGNGKEVKLNISDMIHLIRTRGKSKGQNVKLSPANYLHLVELGHKKGRGKGAARAFPFMQKAANEANRIIPAVLGDAVKTAMKTE